MKTEALHFEISVNGGSWTDPAASRLAFGRLELASSAPDRLAFSLPAAQRATIQPQDFVQVRINGRNVFAGRAHLQTDSLAANAQRVQGIILGPWHLLEAFPFVRNFTGFPNGGAPAWGFGSGLSSECDCFRGPAGALINVGAQAMAALAPAEYQVEADTGRAEFRVGRQPLGMLPPQVVPVSATSIAEIVRLCDRWMPGLVRWVDYTQQVPVLEVDYSAGDYIELDRSVGPPWQTNAVTDLRVSPRLRLELGDLLIMPSDLRARWDLVPKNLAVRSFNPANYIQLAFNPSPFYLQDRWLWHEAGAVGPLPAGTALAIGGYMDRVHYESTVPLRGLLWDLRPGYFLDIPFVQGEQTSSEIRVQAVAFDFAQRTTTVTTGFPRQLGTGDFLQLQSMGRRLVTITPRPTTV